MTFFETARFEVLTVFPAFLLLGSALGRRQGAESRRAGNKQQSFHGLGPPPRCRRMDQSQGPRRRNHLGIRMCFMCVWWRVVRCVCVFVCMEICMHACTNGWMDGWMDGCVQVAEPKNAVERLGSVLIVERRNTSARCAVHEHFCHIFALVLMYSVC